MEDINGPSDSEKVGLNEIFTVKKGEIVIVGSDPEEQRPPRGNEKYIQIKSFSGVMLSPREIEITLNNDGDPQIKRLSSRERHPIFIWGQDKKHGRAWYNSHLVETLQNSFYERIKGGAVVIDIQIDTPEGKSVVRLNDAGRKDQEERSFRVELNPEKLDLSS